MITMNTVVLRGRMTWDQGYFPRDENEERLRAVQEEMSRRDLPGLVVFGHCTRYDDLCYLTQFFPMANYSLAVVPAQGDITLVSGLGGGRDIPASRMRTWVGDVRNLRSLSNGLPELLAERGIDDRVGLVGLEDSLPAALHDGLLTVLSRFNPVPADDLVAGLRRSLRPREISAMREAGRIVQLAREALATAWMSGASNAAALVEADGAARGAGANDSRGLVNLDNSGELAPLDELSPFRSETLTAYLAVSFLGYWADLAFTLSSTDTPLLREAEAALRVMVDEARPGLRAGELARLAIKKIDPARMNDALRYGLGNGIGLSRDTSPVIAPDNDELLVENSMLALRVRLTNGGPGAFVSEMVLVRRDGGRSLFATV